MRKQEVRTGGRIAVDADAGRNLTLSVAEIEADVYVTRPERTPLSVAEPHATVKVAGDGATVEVGLDAEAVAAVLDGLQRVQEFHMEGSPDE